MKRASRLSQVEWTDIRFHLPTHKMTETDIYVIFDELVHAINTRWPSSKIDGRMKLRVSTSINVQH